MSAFGELLPLGSDSLFFVPVSLDLGLEIFFGCWRVRVVLEVWVVLVWGLGLVVCCLREQFWVFGICWGGEEVF